LKGVTSGDLSTFQNLLVLNILFRIAAMKKIIILVSLFLPTFVFGAVANIDHIVFISAPQTVAPDSISKVLTIQTQNVSGVLEAIDETSDLTVTINSPTGQFNSNSTTWNPASTFTMSKNTGNKNFYYKDITEGTYTINATLMTRTTGKSWTTSQDIIISNTPPEVDSNVDAETDTDATSTADFSPSGPISTHYIQEDLSKYVEPVSVFELSAGRARPDVLHTFLFHANVAGRLASLFSDALTTSKTISLRSSGGSISANGCLVLAALVQSGESGFGSSESAFGITPPLPGSRDRSTVARPLSSPLPDRRVGRAVHPS